PMRMNGLMLMALGLCWLTGNTSVVAQAPSATFSLRLSTASPEVHSDQDIIVTIQMTNIWINDIAIPGGGPGGPNSMFHLDVRNDHGDAVKETEYGMKMH